MIGKEFDPTVACNVNEKVAIYACVTFICEIHMFLLVIYFSHKAALRPGMMSLGKLHMYIP